jgi:putative phosphoribosyl transferase
MDAPSASTCVSLTPQVQRGACLTSSGSRPTAAVMSLVDPPPLAPRPRAFADRREAGRRLAEQLERFRAQRPVIVAVPRGGVPVAAEVARALDAPLDVVVVRKVGAPQNPEFAIGAIAEGGVRVLSERTTRAIGLSAQETVEALAKAEAELAERSRELRGQCPALDLHGRVAIAVDDGLATGHTARAAVQALRRRGAARVILAVPVAEPSSVRALAREADEVVCVEEPRDLWAVGLWYEDFSPTGGPEIAALLAPGANAESAPPPTSSTEPA